MAAISEQDQMGCCVFLRLPSYAARHGYRALAMDGHDSSSENKPTVQVIVGKEKRVFFVDPFVLRKDPFRVLFETVRKEKGEKDAIFVDVDSILFEHMLWLAYNEASSLFELNLEEIIEFYSQD
ncbi:uncharacterized protein LOC109828685 [Asparagus officinalis]|uniref:uncharacterized protein LOC109828685 n=1 Tax=Asparagus officinalis TaxID=4686 RepID=UPI00098E1F04|nr:uncharacterized protein LOC109828685 [Asparagus officinalis]